MAYIKKLVMQGFKSFVRRTEIPLTPEINVVLGPNGSGKSNITDALCFVLGRLSIKSMRAAKAKNLIFSGTKAVSAAREASVEMVFDNSDKTFTIDKSEISIKRIVRKNGQSLYKINGETKTRQDVLALLAQASIDPHGFNIILQGEIQNFVRMHTEERRKIIEEVSGISIYEARKEKSLKELNRTEEKLKEVMAVLRERTAYLNNLEKERQEALRFKKLEANVKRYKASIIQYDLNSKEKEIKKIETEIEEKNKQVDKIKKKILELQSGVNTLENKIKSINDTVQKSTGLEQERLNQEIAEIRANIAGLSVKVENYQSKLNSNEKQQQELNQSIRETELSIKELRKESPSLQKKQQDLEKKKKELELLEEERKKFYTTKTELKSLKERLQDKESTLQSFQKESDFLLKQIESLSSELFDKKTSQEKLSELHLKLEHSKSDLEKLNENQKELDKTIHTSEHEIKRLEKIKSDIPNLETCPLCKNKITKEHIKSIHEETNPKIKEFQTKIDSAKKQILTIEKERERLVKELGIIDKEISKRESDLVKISQINDKKEQIKSLQAKIEKQQQEISLLEKRKNSLDKAFDSNSTVEQRYETTRVEVQEIAAMREEDLDSEISFKERELERSKIVLKQLSRDSDDLKEELSAMNADLDEKEEDLEDKISQEEELTKKFKMLLAERDFLQDKIRQNETEKLGKQNEIHKIEQETNNIKIERARLNAEYDNLKTDFLTFRGVEVIKLGRDILIQKLQLTQQTLDRIGSVNLRSLEVYDSVKAEYDSIKDKVEIIEKEKEKILKIVHEIDIKKKKTFLKTLGDLNEVFSRNFAQLSTKGHVSLELENRKEPFEGGVSISVKVGQGKYFDVTSLSGGEQTLVALSLIFAIQEYSPYCFYILDEIDAALDKRNSERLAALLKKYMKKGQYIVITHNDEIISSAATLYGISMHDGISKIVSLKV